MKYIVCFALLLGVNLSTQVSAQNNKKKGAMKTLTVKVVDPESQPIFDAELITSEGKTYSFTDENGVAQIKADSKKGIILIEAEGYYDKVINLSKGPLPQQVEMERELQLTTGKHIINRCDGGLSTTREMVGATSSVDGEMLNRHPDYSLSNTLQGRLAGVVVSQTVNSFGNNASGIYIRGLHRSSSNGGITLIDGMERSLNDIEANDIESITVLKDATAKILYGPRAANGVIVVTTKRGLANKRTMHISLESGAMMQTRQPEYLDSYNYATLYNEARQNDGLSPYYSDEQIEGYKNSKGANDLRYPNVDYYDMFVKNVSLFNKVNYDLQGGNDRILYSLNANYMGGTGYEAVGERPKLNRINLRGNLDVKITDYITAVAGAMARYESRSWGKLDGGAVYTQLSTRRPNEYPLVIDPKVLDKTAHKTGVPYFGSTVNYAGNLLADMGYGGKSGESYIVSNSNLGLRIDLREVTEGLKFGGNVRFDNYDYFKETQYDTHETYAINGYDQDGNAEYVQMRKTTLNSKKARANEQTQRTISWDANLGYDHSFDKHDVSANLAHNFYTLENKGIGQDIKNTHSTLRLNYGYDDRYIIEGDLALMGSNRFAKENRYFLSSAIGGAWILSNEEFMADNKNVDFLKFKASYGRIGYDSATSFLLYETSWVPNGTLSLGEQNKTANVDVVDFVSLASDVDWEYSSEYNFGLEGFMFGNRLHFDVNYFREMRNNIIMGRSADMAGILGGYSTVYNGGKVRNHGVDFSVNWEASKGDFSYNVGLNGLWSKNKLVEWNEMDYPDAYTNSVGLPTDAMTGYTALGLFGRNVALEGHPQQKFGNYQEGDIAYLDVNGDGIVDNRDQTTLGNSHPRVAFGIDVNLKYKNWGLYVLGTSELGINSWLNNSYYWVSGEDKYSAIVADRYHAENNPNGNYPRLSVYAASNNQRASTCWLENTSFFRLKNVELSYTFNFRHTKVGTRSVKIYSHATNLFVLSGVKDLDPEVLNAGVANYSLSRTITGGVSVSF